MTIELVHKQASVLAVEVVVEGDLVVHAEALVAVSVREEGAVEDREPPAITFLRTFLIAISSH
jgi:hypothetical protein